MVQEQPADRFGKSFPLITRVMTSPPRKVPGNDHVRRPGQRLGLDLPPSNESIDELVARKLSGAEKDRLDVADIFFHEREYQRLVQQLERDAERSTLPEKPACRSALNDLLVRLRLHGSNVRQD